MTEAAGAAASPWSEAALAAAILALDPHAIGGVALRTAAGPERDRWLALVRALLPAEAPVRRLPLQVTDGRLLGGLDLAATLAAGRPVVERGLLADADGGIVVLAMAERLPVATGARLVAALDAGAVVLERDGIARRTPARFGIVALDEGIDDERPPGVLLDRLAIHLALDGRGADGTLPGIADVRAARIVLSSVTAGETVVRALCEAAMALGIVSLRAPLHALRVARAAAALAGRRAVEDADVAAAGRLVLAPRATTLPSAETAAEPPPQQPGEAPPDADRDDPTTGVDRPLEDMVVAAARAAMPADLLARLLAAGGRPRTGPSAGGAGVQKGDALRGRPAGTRRGDPRGGARLDVVETLRAAAPWQRLRRGDGDGVAVAVRRDDFRVKRFKRRTETTTVFAVDASGSSALHRMAEAKGAVELLLADCYVRRDRVALLAFRGRDAVLVLPPTRSLARAKRCLAAMVGGGGTPLAAGIAAAASLAEEVGRKGGTAVLVLLTDGRANVDRGGIGGREKAMADAMDAARLVRAAALVALLVDTNPQPQAAARRLADAMAARYLPLPHADAKTLSGVVRAAVAA